MAEFGIFRKGEDKAFFGADNLAILEAIYAEAETALGTMLVAAHPDNGDTVQKIGSVMLSAVTVEDKSVYKIETSKESVDSKPGAPGSRVVQSLVFDASKFDLAQAKAWIVANAKFSDNGHDATGGSIRFRQYNPQDFVEGSMLTTPITDGVVGVTGLVAGAPEESEEETAAGKAAKAMTKFMSTGLRALPGTAVVNKNDEGTEERLVMSLVLEPNDGDEGVPLKPDTQGDIYSAGDIRKAAHNWMENHGKSDLEHSWDDLGKSRVGILESYIAPVDFELGGYNVVKGTWMLALRIVDDELWTAVKSGEIGAFSIGGTAMRSPVEPESKNESN